MSSETRPLGPSIAFVRTGPAFRAREEAACHFPFGGVEIPWRRDGGVDLSLPRLGGEATRWRLRLGFRDRGELVSRSAGIYQENRKIGGGGGDSIEGEGPARALHRLRKPPKAVFVSRFLCRYKKRADDLAIIGPRERVSEVSGSQKRLRRGSSEELPGGDPKVSGKRLIPLPLVTHKGLAKP